LTIELQLDFDLDLGFFACLSPRLKFWVCLTLFRLLTRL